MSRRPSALVDTQIPPAFRPLGYALGAALLGAFVVTRYYPHAPLGTPGPDFDQAWWMARELLQGHNPYTADLAQHRFVTPIFYPLTAAVVALPLALLPLEAARLVFVAGTAALLGYAVGRYRPELWPLFLGIPFFIALRSAQWSPLLTSAMILPALGWLGAVKPNLGVAMLAGAKSKRSALILLIGGGILVVVSLAIHPQWPFEWRAALTRSEHFRPLLARPGGFLVLLGLLRWRDPDARLLVALAVVPMTGLFYDLLPAGLVARTQRQATILALCTLIGWQVVSHFVERFASMPDQMWLNGTVALWFALLPPLVIVLARGTPVTAWGVDG